MTRPQRLSATFIRTVKQPGRYGDGRGGFGLSLLVKPMASGGISKSFSQRLRLHCKPFNIGLGSFPLVTLAEAREAAIENARAAHKGFDPRAARERQVSIPTFEDAAETVVAIHAKTWKTGSKTEKLWRSRLAEYAHPKIGSMQLSEITSGDVLSIVEPLWAEKRETATKLRQHIGAIMKWAVVEGYREDNPASPEIISTALPKTTTPRKHHRALAFADVASALTTITASEAYEATKIAIEFLVLTATRSGDVRGAMWTEIDGDVWTIPGERMKSPRDHRVPLSRQAVEVLERAREYQDTSGLIFSSQRGKIVSDNTLSKLFRELDIAGTPHGMRSSFRDWAVEKTEYPSEIAEHALAHIEGTATERAYRRTDYFDKRRELMQAWADYLNR